MGIFNFLRPAPLIEEIKDPVLVDKTYKYWRLRTFYAMYIGYAFYYFTRNSFIVAMPAMQESLGMSKVELGLIGSILSISYGASKFLSGILGDKSNPRYFMSIGLIITGILNFCFGLSSSWWAFAIFWGLNGCFQGWGWPGCAKLLSHWYSRSERGRWWSIWNTSHNLGGAVIPLLGAACIEAFGWRFAMYVPGVLCILSGFFIMNRLRDTPGSLGLPPIEKYRNDDSDLSRGKEKTDLSVKSLLWNYVLKNKFIWILAGSYFFIYVIRTSINSWSMLYLIEAKNYTNIQAGFCICLFDVGGFLGSLTAGWASDVLFKGRRIPINILFTSGILGLIFLFQQTLHSFLPLDALFLFLFGFFIFGPQMLIGVAAAELSHKKAAATSTGFIGCFAYLGAAIAGAPLGKISRDWGWDGFFMTLSVCALLGLLLMLPLWSVHAKDIKPLPSPIDENSKEPVMQNGSVRSLEES